MEHKLLSFEIKAFNDDTGELSGYANVSGVLDRQDEIVEPGAYADLESLVKDGFSAVGHNSWNLPIGTIEEAREDSKGLFVRIKFHSTGEAQAARTVVKERFDRGKSVGLSIGYDVLESARETRDGVEIRILKKIKVWEVSIVTVPANQESLVVAAKQINDLSGVPLEKHAQTVVSVVEALVKRAKDKSVFRQAENRDLSDAQKAQLSELQIKLGELSQMLSALCTDKDAEAEKQQRLDEARELEARFYASMLLEH